MPRKDDTTFELKIKKKTIGQEYHASILKIPRKIEVKSKNKTKKSLSKRDSQARTFVSSREKLRTFSANRTPTREKGLVIP